MLFADFPNSKFRFPEFVSSYAWHVTIPIFHFVKILTVPTHPIHLCCCLMVKSQGGGGVSHISFIHRLGPSIYRSPPKNIRDFKHPQKIKFIESNPKYSSIFVMTPPPPPTKKKYTKYSYPQKYYIFMKTSKY